MKTLNNLKAGFLLFRCPYKIYKEASLTANVQYGYGNCYHILFKGRAGALRFCRRESTFRPRTLPLQEQT